MFKVFSHKKQRANPAQTALQKINQAINKRFHRWAGYLNNKASGASRRSIKYILLVFCLYWGSASLYIMIRGLQKKEARVSVTAITIPKHILKIQTTYADTITLQVFRRIETFKRWLDSLHRDGKGIVIYDSIIKKRPGLTDSLQMVENIYRQLLKK